MSFSIPPHLRGKTTAQRNERCNRAAVLAGVSSDWLRGRNDDFKDALSVGTGRAVLRTEQGKFELREFLQKWLTDEEFAAIDQKGAGTAAVRERVRQSAAAVGRRVEVPEEDPGEVYKTRAAAQRFVEAMRDGRRTAKPDLNPYPDAPPPLPGV
jgi:hypothetical protein